LSRGENISPFNQYTESDFPTKETLMMEDETDETFELNPKYAYQPSDPESPVPDHQSSSSRKRAYILPDSDEDLQSESSSTLQRGTRAELWAPAGKLGVAIDVVKGHPIVWRIKDGSPLEGFLKKGDIIVGIDEIDTSRMSAADVTSVMVRRMRQRRKITYVRPDQ
jgi:C-terminal processing protease CtpA/Prc